MQLEVGKIYDGKVKGIAQYGAFVEIEGAGYGYGTYFRNSQFIC